MSSTSWIPDVMKIPRYFYTIKQNFCLLFFGKSNFFYQIVHYNYLSRPIVESVLCIKNDTTNIFSPGTSVFVGPGYLSNPPGQIWKGALGSSQLTEPLPVPGRSISSLLPSFRPTYSMSYTSSRNTVF